jgi:hypothetical protein
MTNLQRHLRDLREVFKTTPDKREAHRRASEILANMTADASVITDVLAQNLSSAGFFNQLHYPVVALHVERNAYYHLVANCWIPLPNRATNISTKAVHHHGTMLLSTATAWGPGYEHWLFTLPRETESLESVYSAAILERGPHPCHHVAFVDSFTAHLPFYPRSLTITLALWSSESPVNWKDRVKKLPILQKQSGRLRNIATQLGLARQLELKIVENFDFYPLERGLCAMPARIEFKRGPNEDFLYSLFHVMQQTGNESLVPLVRRRIDEEKVDKPALVSRLLEDLENGRPIDGRLSAGHYDVPHLNFTVEELERALGQ